MHRRILIISSVAAVVALGLITFLVLSRHAPNQGSSSAPQSPATQRVGATRLTNIDVNAIFELRFAKALKVSLDATDDNASVLAALINRDPERMATRSDEWVVPMMQAQKFTAVANLSLQLIEKFPYNTQLIMKLQPNIARAVLFRGGWERALFAAKGMYNVCTLDQTDIAIALMDQCLHDARLKQDPDVIRRFNTEQALGTRRRQWQSPAPTTAPTTMPETILDSITADRLTNPTYARLQHDVANIDGDDYKSLVGRGNLFLLLDQPEQSASCFEKAVQIANDAQHAEAVENLSRAIKAQDGTIGRATAWLDQNKSAKALDLAALRVAAPAQPRPAPSVENVDLSRLPSIVNDSIHNDDDKLPAMFKLVDEHPVEMASRTDEWAEPLFKNRRFSGLANLCLELIKLRPYDTQMIMTVQPYVVRCLLNQGSEVSDRALFAAKGMYNVCTMDKTDEAVNLMIECLRVARLKGDPEIIDRFNAEQAAAANVPQAEAATKPTTQSLTVLQSIKAKHNRIYVRLMKDMGSINGYDYQAVLGRANLLLLGDEVANARLCFESAARFADDKHLPEVNENFARLMKAEDGGTGRANAWLATHQGGKQ